MFSITNETKRRTPSVPFEEIKNKVLGKRYELSLVFVGNKLSRRLNRVYRSKDKSTNVLSFPITKSSPACAGVGEIFINLSHSKLFGPTHLFIHGLLHLKGMRHGDRMERMEAKFLKKFHVQ